MISLRPSWNTSALASLLHSWAFVKQPCITLGLQNSGMMYADIGGFGLTRSLAVGTTTLDSMEAQQLRTWLRLIIEPATEFTNTRLAY